MNAFYERLDHDRYRASTWTRGPWSIDHQHAGPPSALLGGALAAALAPGRVSRVTFEVLRPVPIADLHVSVQVDRPGRRVAMGSGVLSDADGPLLLARAWRLREKDVPLAPDRDLAPPPLNADTPTGAFFDVPWDEGYHHAMDVRFVSGSFVEPGDATAWLRCLREIVAGHPITPLERVLVAADSGNGLSSRFSPTEWLFVNTDLSVHLREHPAGEWVGMAARTRFGPDGIGLADTRLFGEQGEIGLSAQTLIVEPQAR